ncbi:ABC transporter A family protein [Tieghemostelium lacteum]|uniref:ABC transporter A family protein n=1 Tax=Tieghemostelium lacteum TaxID=361077 RepID=A0A151ZB74_TIELA|nr:ABC transporter A family protein [Tieghemostelium lacteum]|eukprot:KYQ91202.1 ABC transporter A family protein [Tieghemostelium lacteum]
MHQSSDRVVKASKFQQLIVLLYKQSLLMRRHFGLSIVKFGTPIIMMVLYIAVYTSLKSTVYTTYEPQPLLMEYKTYSNYLIGYSDNGFPNLNSLVNSVAEFLDLEVGKDIVALDPVYQNNITMYYNRLGKEGVKTYFAVFEFDSNTQYQYYSHVDTIYTLMYNSQDQTYPNPLIFNLNYYNVDFDSPELQYGYTIQVAIENAIAKMKLGPDADISINLKKPPSIIESSGSPPSTQLMPAFTLLFVFVGYTLPFIVFLQQIVDEKERKIRSYFRTFGVYDELYLLAWYIDGLITTIYTTAVFMIFGYSFTGFTPFHFTTPSLIFSILITYGIALYAFAVLLSTVLSKTKAAVIIGVVLFLFGILYGLFSCLLGDLLYNIWSKKPYIVTIIFDILPPTNFIKIFSDISYPSVKTIANAVLDASSSGEPATYTWNTFMKQIVVGKDKFFGLPSPYESLNILFFLTFLYLFLAWYFDKVLASEFGGKRPWNFLFTSQYWSPVHFYKQFNEYELTGRDRSHDTDLQAENVSINPTNYQNHALIIRNLYKAYGENQAVNGLNLSAEKGKVLALLGHNGCGKTSTINMLVGQSNPDSGFIAVHGYDVQDQIQFIQPLVGFCPQHDIYWPYFTAREHLYILLLAKEQRSNINKDINDILKEVRLHQVADNHVSTYSGGMRRRLSVALSIVGNPQVCILDEPTTGIDPMNAKILRNLIKSLKKDKLIILTTHSMAEAESLGDKIAIMNKGKLATVGTPLYLKNKYNMGYKLNLISNNIEQCKILVQSRIRTAVFDKVNSNSISYIISNLDDLSDFLRYLVSDKASQELISDWQIQNTSLEDVFLRIVHN